VSRSLEDLIVSSSEAIRPMERLNAWQAAEKHWHLSGQGSKGGRYSIESTPYLREPMETLDSLEHTGMCFVGPARTGKSAMALGWICETVMCDPSDMMIINMTQNSAKDLSKSELTRMFNRNPELKSRLTPGRQNDNVHNKFFTSGMRLLISWPSITELSGKTIPRLWLFDYDRDDGYKNVGGEGPAFPLARKRAQTFGRFGMTGVESSPGVDVDDPKWMPETPHQGPPIKEGIVSIYNQGDRRLLYWECPSCHDAFEPDFHLFDYPRSADLMESAEQAVLKCPHCGFSMRQSMRDELNYGATWVRDNMIWIPTEKRVVPLAGRRPIRSDIASFWLKSPPAFFTSWREVVLKYLQAERHFNETSDEGALKTVFNLDLGLPYTPKSKVSDRVPEELKERAEDWGGSQDHPMVPDDVRALVACVDVQSTSFVVQVHGLAAGGEIVVIDSFKIRTSKRLDRDEKPMPIKPATYAEDWDQLVEEVIERSYPLADGSGRQMSIRMTACDSQGEKGVAPQALNFWRRLKKAGDGHHRRFAFIRGVSTPNAPMVKFDYPGETTRKDRNSGARGDVPMLYLNSNKLKDQLANLLERSESGGGRIRWPDWIPDWFYSQLCAEVRVDGKWENPRRKRNEAWDLLYYLLAVVQKGHDSGPWPTFKLLEVDWSDPPGWAQDWDDNDFVFGHREDGASAFLANGKKRSLKDIAGDLA
jgi:phage terminase large subunit GpA-like protein